ncbi:hypothetical protein COO60DRAFT_1625354 [Scenedesmus sp. NREL 46B-D3]|nr:hypothetical protein COO60DRAFT_1625354 [Scenedesmus sp. NREL 46B-D3]
MCLVSADAYATANSILTPLDTSGHTSLAHQVSTGQLRSVDGRCVQISPTPNKCMTATHQECVAAQQALQYSTEDQPQHAAHMEIDPPQQPSVYWCNPLAQADPMEISSDDERDEDAHPNTSHTMAPMLIEERHMQPDQPPELTTVCDDDNPNEENVVWVDPTTVGLYCEPQVAMQCLCHAWHALLGRKVARKFFYSALQSSNAPRSELAAFGRSGPYHPGGLNLYAVEHSTDNRMVTLAGFLNCSQQRYSKQQILEHAPANCKGMIAHFSSPTSVHHYSAWRQAADGHWYDCDSIPYGQTGKVKRMQSRDWEDFTGSLYCLVELDPLEHGYALFNAPRSRANCAAHGERQPPEVCCGWMAPRSTTAITNNAP